MKLEQKFCINKKNVLAQCFNDKKSSVIANVSTRDCSATIPQRHKSTFLNFFFTLKVPSGATLLQKIAKYLDSNPHIELFSGYYRVLCNSFCL